MKAFAIATMVTLLNIIGPASAADNVTKEAWKVTLPSYACKSNDNYSKLIKLMMSGDDTAAVRFITPLTLSGDCIIMQPGKVFLDEASVFGNPCVRKRGEVDCFFTRRENLEPVQ